MDMFPPQLELLKTWLINKELSSWGRNIARKNNVEMSLDLYEVYP